MDALADVAGTYAILILAATMVAVLLTLLLIGTWAGRYGPALRALYQRASAYVAASRWIPHVTQRLPWLRRAGAIPAAAIWIPLASFGVILLCLALFAELAEGIGPDDELHLFDEALSEALRAHASDGVRAFFAAATHLGGGYTLASIGIVVAVVLLAKRRTVLLYGWVIALAGSGLLNPTLKALFERARPGEVPLLDTWSFPSGHAMNSLVAYGMLAYLLSRGLPVRWMPAIVGAAVSIAILVGASRLFLYVHYFSDVIAGFAAGLAWLAVCIAATELALRRA